MPTALIPTGIRKKSQSRAFKLTKKDLLTVTEHAPDVICRFDTSFRLLYVNPAIEVATGIPPHAFKNKTTRELGMPEEHSLHWEKHISQVVTTGERTTMEFPFLTPAHGLRFFQAVLVPEFTNDGVVETVLTISRDITEKKELERKKAETVSLVSHELKTPITSLKVSAQVLQKKFAKDGDNDTAAQLAKMNQQIDKLTNIIGDLTDTTRIEQGSIKLSKAALDFNELVNELVEEVQKTTVFHKIYIKGSVKRRVVGDRFRIGQVITNLLSNAIRYSPDEADIIISLQENQKQITCSVQDFGMGIPYTEQAKIFERFYRVKNIEQSIYMGLGLGLYIASEIIKLHKGKIWVKSTPKKGSTFSFRLPVG
jgi:PAS domain S-box-containing protein